VGHLWIVYSVVAPGLEKKAEEDANVAYKIVVGKGETFGEAYGGEGAEAMARLRIWEPTL
jgi:hypothetical protein